MSVAMWRTFITFLVSRIFLIIIFSFLRRTLYNTWKNHYKQFQVPIMIFNKKAPVNISSISNSKNLPWNLLSFVLWIAVKEYLKNRIVLVLLQFGIIIKTIKTLSFTFAQSVKPRFVIQRRIQNLIKHLGWSILRK